MSSPEAIVHDLTPLERHRMLVDEAVAQLTHKCRKYPGLKLRPDACEKRKSKRQKIFRDKSYPIFDGCSGCPGPVPIEEDAPKPEPKPIPPSKTRKRRQHPTVCTECGRTPEQVHFYPSNPYQCAVCLRARDRARTARQKSWTPIEEEPQPMTQNAAEQPQDPQEISPIEAQPVMASYHCEIHGDHNGRMFGKQHSSVCPQCHSARMSQRMKEVRAREVKTEPPSTTAITLPDWIADWAQEQCAQHGISGKEFAVGLIGEHIPADWLKNWLIKRAKEA